MFKSIAYVIKENMTNLYRIFCIARYELLADMRDSKFGLFWKFCFSGYSGHYLLARIRYRNAAERL